VDEAGPVVVNAMTGFAYVPPLVKVERESRQLLARIWTNLHLEWRSDEHGRIRKRKRRARRRAAEPPSRPCPPGAAV
jgi:hypothetical protein